MNYLKGRKVYLSGPIHKANDDGISWREIVTPKLQSMGLEVLDPCGKHVTLKDESLSEIGDRKKYFSSLVMAEEWDKLKEEFWPIVRADLRMIDHCDFIIIDHDPTVPTVGTWHELVVATFEKKVILLKYDKDQLDKFNPWVATFIKPSHFFSEWDRMFSYLEEVNNGKKDTSYWVL